MNNQQENIDKYLKDELSASEKLAFEQAMETDESLKKSVQKQAGLRRFFEQHNPEFDALNQQLAQEFFSDDIPPDNTPNSSKPKPYIKIIAISLFFLIMAIALFYYYNRPKTTSKPSENNTIKQEIEPQQEIPQKSTDSIVQPFIPSVEEAIEAPSNSKENTEKSPQPMADATSVFQENEVFETLIRENVRSNENDVTIIEPITTEIQQPKSANYTIFELTGSFDKDFDYTITFYDNSENAYTGDKFLLTTNQQTTNQEMVYRTNLKFSKGLYYYMVTSKKMNETIFVGKFIVDK